MTDLAGKVTFEALDTKALDARKKALADAYEKACKEESDPKPTKPVVNVLKSGIAEKTTAEAHAARCKAAYEKKLKEKQAGT